MQSRRCSALVLTTERASHVYIEAFFLRVPHGVHLAQVTKHNAWHGGRTRRAGIGEWKPWEMHSISLKKTPHTFKKKKHEKKRQEKKWGKSLQRTQIDLHLMCSRCALSHSCAHTHEPMHRGTHLSILSLSPSQQHRSQAGRAAPRPCAHTSLCLSAHQCQCQKSSSWPPRMPWVTSNFLICLCYFLFVLHITEVWISNAFSFTWENWRKLFVAQQETNLKQKEI